VQIARHILSAILRFAAWLALAFLGFWLALLINDAVFRLLLFPALGWPVSNLRLSAFRVMVWNGAPETAPLAAGLRFGFPALGMIGFLAAVLRWGMRAERDWARVLIHFAAIWLLLDVAGQLSFLPMMGRGWLNELLRSFAPVLAQSALGRWAVVAALGAACLAAAVALCSRLIRGWLPQAGASVIELQAGFLALTLSVAVLHWSSVAARFRGFSSRVSWLVALPFASFLAAAVAGLFRAARRRPGLPEPGREPKPLQPLTAAVCAALGILLYQGLTQASQMEAAALEARLARVQNGNVEVRFHPEEFAPAAAEEFAAGRAPILLRQAEKLRALGLLPGNFSGEDLRARYVLLKQFSEKGALAGDDRAFTVRGGTIYVLRAEPFPQLAPAAEAAVVLPRAWGRSSSETLAEWAAVWLAGEWEGRGVEEWAARIAAESGAYGLETLLKPAEEFFVSPYVRTPLGAAFLGYVARRKGNAAVRALYDRAPGNLSLAEAGRLLGETPEQLARGWMEYQNALPASREAADAHRSAPAAGDSLPFLRGMTFSHEGFGGRRGGGYAGPAAEEQLALLRAMGANAIAVVPFGFLSDARDLTISAAFTDETDEEMTQALHVARRLGLKVMLKPQLWVGGGAFTGTIHFEDARDRAQWMRSYREFALHYARLAELRGFDLYSIGNELGGLTRHEAEWRALIADVRRVYRGPLTYAANWGEEFERLRFWDALDFIGLNNYYPLGATQASRAEEMQPAARALAAELADMHRRWRRPILFTEVGYPSVRGGSREPWVQDRARGIDLEEQAAAYEAVLRTFPQHDWFRGMFWWKWPSSGRGGGPADPTFTPLRKPAEKVLRAWYIRLQQEETARRTAPAPAASPASSPR
jgi:hypothetical protein